MPNKSLRLPGFLSQAFRKDWGLLLLISYSYSQSATILLKKLLFSADVCISKGSRVFESLPVTKANLVHKQKRYFILLKIWTTEGTVLTFSYQQDHIFCFFQITLPQHLFHKLNVVPQLFLATVPWHHSTRAELQRTQQRSERILASLMELPTTNSFLGPGGKFLIRMDHLWREIVTPRFAKAKSKCWEKCFVYRSRIRLFSKQSFSTTGPFLDTTEV